MWSSKIGPNSFWIYHYWFINVLVQKCFLDFNRSQLINNDELILQKLGALSDHSNKLTKLVWHHLDHQSIRNKQVYVLNLLWHFKYYILFINPNRVKPLGWVRQFYKISREYLLYLFGLMDLKLCNFKLHTDLNMFCNYLNSEEEEKK